MKKSILFAAYVAAASVAGISASSSSFSSASGNLIDGSRSQLDDHQVADKSKDNKNSGSSDKFAPRFDGLRFIETLITAHR